MPFFALDATGEIDRLQAAHIWLYLTISGCIVRASTRIYIQRMVLK